MNEQEKKSMLEALEYVKNVLEVLPATGISHCEIKVAAYRNTVLVISNLTKAWNEEAAESAEV